MTCLIQAPSWILKQQCRGRNSACKHTRTHTNADTHTHTHTQAANQVGRNSQRKKKRKGRAKNLWKKKGGALSILFRALCRKQIRITFGFCFISFHPPSRLYWRLRRNVRYSLVCLASASLVVVAAFFVARECEDIKKKGGCLLLFWWRKKKGLEVNSEKEKEEIYL